MDPITLLEQLIKIESDSEIARIQDFILDQLSDADLDSTGCIIARKEGDEPGPSLLLNTHMDVVSPHLEFERDGGRIKGRGAADAKGSLAAMMSAFSAVEPTAGSVELVISPDEETTQQGLYNYLSEGIDIDFAIVGEPTGLDVCPAARGHYDLLVTLTGESAHGATPESGVNATRCAAAAIARIERLPQLTDDLLGTNSFTPTIIRGGNRPNQVPDHAEFVVDYRTVPAESREEAISTIEQALDGIRCEYTVDLYENGSSLAAFKTDSSDPFVASFQSHTEAETGFTPAIKPFDAATEAAFFAPYAPVVVFGPGRISDGDQPIAHSAREFVPVADVENAAHVLTEYLTTQLD
ncbi:M20/M25/M40 family metallo-hydrolase [Halalkalicoccus tibetensis]|uniref:M20/M25/M40 family metallo-hydrolase n=1 Tax=Halalkalicoccus tibetensis TaxID=175632 RepID=A0ABD5VC83_9EURY